MLTLFKRHAFSKCRRVDEKCSKQKKNFSMVLIKLIDQLIVNKRLSFKWFYFSIFAYILCNTNSIYYLIILTSVYVALIRFRALQE
mgnify:CR=1 FL=1